MKKEYDFSKGVRGRFYRPNAKLDVPVYLPVTIMPQSTRRHFIIKHGLDALDALPNFIWRTGNGPKQVPQCFNQVRRGDRWIAFAYTTSDRREQSLSLITGFYECTREKRYGDIPLPAAKLREYARGQRKAWMIEGKKHAEHTRRTKTTPEILCSKCSIPMSAKMTILNPAEGPGRNQHRFCRCPYQLETLCYGLPL